MDGPPAGQRRRTQGLTWLLVLMHAVIIWVAGVPLTYTNVSRSQGANGQAGVAHRQSAFQAEPPDLLLQVVRVRAHDRPEHHAASAHLHAEQPRI